MEENSENELLVNEKESLVLEAMAQGDAPYSQRAQAILAFDAGSSIDQAARVANLKDTQVRYWIGRFRNGRLSVFPEALIEQLRGSLKVGSKQSASGKKKMKTKKKKEPKVEKKGSKKSGKKKADKKKKDSGVKVKKKKKKSSKKSAKKKKS